MHMFNVADEWRKIDRILRVASRPRLKDFERMVLVTAGGLVVMGVLGVVISFVLSIHEKIKLENLNY